MEAFIVAQQSNETEVEHRRSLWYTLGTIVHLHLNSSQRAQIRVAQKIIHPPHIFPPASPPNSLSVSLRTKLPKLTCTQLTKQPQQWVHQLNHEVAIIVPPFFLLKLPSYYTIAFTQNVPLVPLLSYQTISYHFHSLAWDIYIYTFSSYCGAVSVYPYLNAIDLPWPAARVG